MAETQAIKVLRDVISARPLAKSFTLLPHTFDNARSWLEHEAKLHMRDPLTRERAGEQPSFRFMGYEFKRQVHGDEG